MIRSLLCFLAFVIVAPASAQCIGNDLIAAMSDADRDALFAQADAHPHPDGILWKARRGDDLVYLVGTLHLYEPRHAATLEQVKPWMDDAATILLELGEGDETRLNSFITANPSYAYITEGPTLIDLMTPENWALLKSEMGKRGVPGFMTAKMKPSTVLITLGMSRCVLTEVQSGKRGLDHMIIDHAREIGKPAKSLEDFKTALTIFDEYTQDEMLEFVGLFLRMEGYDPDDQMHTMVEAYFREEIRVLWEMGVQFSLANPMGWSEDEILEEYAKLEEILVNRRNRAWMDVILPALSEGPVFVAAGALHMPGDQGVLRLLEDEGFALERVARQ